VSGVDAALVSGPPSSGPPGDGPIIASDRNLTDPFPRSIRPAPELDFRGFAARCIRHRPQVTRSWYSPRASAAGLNRSLTLSGVIGSFAPQSVTLTQPRGGRQPRRHLARPARHPQVTADEALVVWRASSRSCLPTYTLSTPLCRWAAEIASVSLRRRVNTWTPCHAQLGLTRSGGGMSNSARRKPLAGDASAQRRYGVVHPHPTE